VGFLFEVVAAIRNRAMNLLAPIDPRTSVATGKAPARR
jgi:hypothetical protein